MVLKFILEKIADITLNLSTFFSIIHVKIVDKLNINIYKPKYEEEILQNTETTKGDVKKLLSNEEELKKYKDREKIIKEIINQEIININNLNQVSKSEYYIIVANLYMLLGNKETRPIILGEEGSFKNSVTKYFEEKGYIKLGKKYSDVYLKSKSDLKKNYRNLIVFKKILDEKFKSMVEKDNSFLIKKINKVKKNKIIKEYFYDSEGKLKKEKYLFFDYMIISTLNLNKENITIIDKKAQQKFLFTILNKEIQNVKLKEIISESGLKFFLNKEYPSEIKKKILGKESSIKRSLKIGNFLEDLNKDDLTKTFQDILKKDFEEQYINAFFNKYNLVRDL